MRILLINLMIFSSLLGLAEICAYGVLYFRGLGAVAPFFYSNENINHTDDVDPCFRARTHPILSHIHDHKGECEIRGGEAVGNFVFYESYDDANAAIVTLGGSTTSGLFFQNDFDGLTWPFILNGNVSGMGYTVINGGAAAYSSNQELQKIILEVRRLAKPVDVIVSLSGENDLYGWDCCWFKDEKFRSKTYPFMTSQAFQMFISNKWLDQRPAKTSYVLLPNLLKFSTRVVSKFSNDKDQSRGTNTVLQSYNDRYFSEISPAERWVKNHQAAHAVASSMGASYIVFLQPAMGITGPQSRYHGATKSSDYEYLQKMLEDGYYKNFWGQPYRLRLNEFYDETREWCRVTEYCIDITSVGPPDNPPNYLAPRHHNQNGNRLVAEAIFNALLKNSAMQLKN
ncbi:SGNH/GDSL hydrolase family protein [Alphaproteobacteria bacterium]|nr:SGNH/GDSL hydrolase family protein [Alphaproteobacteria bacterium]